MRQSVKLGLILSSRRVVVKVGFTLLKARKTSQPGRRATWEAVLKVIQGVVLKAWSESAAVMVCSNVRRGRR